MTDMDLEMNVFTEVIEKQCEIIRIQTDIIDGLSLIALQHCDLDEEILKKIRTAANLQNTAEAKGII